MLTYLKNFLRQPVTILRELNPHERFSQTSRIIPLIKALVMNIRLSRWKKKDWQIMWYFLLWLVLPFVVALSFCGNFLRWEKSCKKTCYNFFAIISFALLPSGRFNLHVYSRLFCQTSIIEMPSLNQNEKNTCENFGTQTIKLNLVRHKKRCSVGTLYCTQCPTFPQNP